MTLLACGPGSMDSKYLSFLNDVNSAAFENEQLILYSEDADKRMLFKNGAGLNRRFGRKLLFESFIASYMALHY